MNHHQRLSIHSLWLYGLLLCLAPISCRTSSKMHSDRGFVPIFDGKTLNGWEGDSTYWRVEDGHIVGEVTPTTLLKNNSFLIWRGGVTKDFELKVDYRVSNHGNSGINYRSEELKNLPHALKGYQGDLDGAQLYTGQNYEERGRTILAYRGQKVMLPTVTGPLQSHVKNNVWTASKVTGSLGNADSLKAWVAGESGVIGEADVDGPCAVVVVGTSCR